MSTCCNEDYFLFLSYSKKNLQQLTECIRIKKKEVTRLGQGKIEENKMKSKVNLHKLYATRSYTEKSNTLDSELPSKREIPKVARIMMTM